MRRSAALAILLLGCGIVAAQPQGEARAAGGAEAPAQDGAPITPAAGEPRAAGDTRAPGPPETATAPPTTDPAPGRVVSMNLCTDQLAMLIAAPGQLIPVSFVARDPVSSSMAKEAQSYPVNHAAAEEIYALDPDLVLTGEFDRPVTLTALDRLGVRVEKFPLEASLDNVRASMTRMGALLGQQARAAEVLAALDAGLPPPAEGENPRAALFYANAWSSGGGTLADDILRKAGLDNVAAARGITGMGILPLEILVTEAPDLVVRGQDYPTPARAQEVLRHPAARALGGERAVTTDNLWVCGTPRSAEAVAGLRAVRDRITNADAPAAAPGEDG